MANETSTVETVIGAGILFILNFVAFFGNLLLCTVLIRTSRRTAPTNVLLFALCTTDLVTATIGMPLTIVSLIKGTWVFGHIACQFQGFTSLTMGMAATEIVALLAINRYCCVVKSRPYRRWFTQRSCLIFVLSTWLFAFLTVTVALSSGSAKFRYYANRATCYISVQDPTAEAVYSLFYLVTFILIPFTVIVYCYSKVLRAVKKHKNSLRKRNSSIKLSAEEINLTYTFLALILCFVICLFPVFVLELVDTFCRACMTRAANLALIFCFYASSSTNVVIYGTMNRSFRSAAARLLRQRSRTVNQDSTIFAMHKT